jgi:AcrR family transcriptional regulator
MPDFTLPITALEAAMPVFHQHGLHTASDAALAAALNTTVPNLTAQFPSRELLVHHAILADMERQKREHVELYAQYPSAVERLYGLLQLGLRDLAAVPGQFYADLQTGFPQTWDAAMENMNSYSAPQLQQLLNDGIRNRLFRSDINIQLVTKILVEQINMMLNPLTFPPDRYNMREVFRSIFLYYIRGICTDDGARIAAEHFARL